MYGVAILVHMVLLPIKFYTVVATTCYYTGWTLFPWISTAKGSGKEYSTMCM